MIVASTPESTVLGAPVSRAHVLAITQKGRIVAAARNPVSLGPLLAEQPSQKHGEVTFARQRKPNE